MLRNRTEFSPVKSRDFTVKVCNPEKSDTKAELNRRSQACESPGRHRCSRRERIGAPISESASEVRGMAVRGIDSGRAGLVFLPIPLTAIPLTLLCGRADSAVGAALTWNPVLDSHQPLRFCKPPPELLGQRDVKLKCGRRFSSPSALINCREQSPRSRLEPSSLNRPRPSCCGYALTRR